MICQSCVDEVKMSLYGRPGDSECEEIMRRGCDATTNENCIFCNIHLRTTLPAAEVKRLLEETGKLVIFRGHGGIGQEGEMRMGGW